MPSLFVDELTVIDCAYLHPQRGVIGESWLVDVELEGELNDEGMLFDFGPLKKELKRLIDEQVDHALLVPTRSTRLTLERHGDEVELIFTYGDNLKLIHHSPEQALCLIDAETIDEAAVISQVHALVDDALPENVTALHIGLRNEVTDSPYFHYSHGLKKHCGNCQRIAHGHRSKIFIEKDGEFDKALTQQWALAWKDIYLATESDCETSFHEEGVEYLRFSYRSQQGHFSLTIPKQECYLIKTDTTIELLSQHIAEQLHQAEPGHHYRVRVYEGINKGAVATC